MLAQGLPLRDVQLQLRHADPRMTMRYEQGKNSLDRAAVLPYGVAVVSAEIRADMPR
jgi:hypothetical protein